MPQRAAGRQPGERCSPVRRATRAVLWREEFNAFASTDAVETTRTWRWRGDCWTPSSPRGIRVTPDGGRLDGPTAEARPSSSYLRRAPANAVSITSLRSRGTRATKASFASSGWPFSSVLRPTRQSASARSSSVTAAVSSGYEASPPDNNAKGRSAHSRPRQAYARTLVAWSLWPTALSTEYFRKLAYPPTGPSRSLNRC